MSNISEYQRLTEELEHVKIYLARSRAIAQARLEDIRELRAERARMWLEIGKAQEALESLCNGV